ncbi:hypothetical protein MCUN1_003191 [Malassezia cuniculi]|uniref:Inositol polyphosphate-related phosphatase domain-containing protein n=1 Tax=Malassezia cuniculi TaxID=948313 RepID=A0AAF0J772_9BASI|nr:hypothetical protein MCUN1_003191 [Malassezia cuniculi]
MAHGLRVQVASYNINQQVGKRLLPELHEWLIPTVTQDPRSGYATAGSKPKGDNGPREAPDIYAVAFQEFAPLPKSLAGITDSYVYTIDRELRRTIRMHQPTVRKDNLYDPLETGGGPENYSLLAAAHHAGLVLYVYSRDNAPQRGGQSATARVREVRTSTVGTGIGGIMGNKGAVGVRVVLEAGGREEVLTFVGAHLAAHDHMVKRRNEDWKNIVTRLVFAPYSTQPLPVVQDRIDPTKPNSIPNEPPKRPPPRPTANVEYSMYDTNHLFVCGDLNYRIGTKGEGIGGAAPLSKDQVRAMIANGSPEEWATLAKHDQLSVQAAIRPARVFQQLTVTDPGMLTPPTYKYKTGSAAASTSVFDIASQLSAKRIPGWTDRILWSTSARLELYRSIMQYTISDHKPITAILRLEGTSPILSPPWPIDPRWQTLQYAGYTADRIVGYVWSTLLLLGSGSLVLAAVELALLVALASWWLVTPNPEATVRAILFALKQKLRVSL